MDYRPVFEHDESRVKDLRIDELQAGLRIAGKDRLPASAPNDEGEDRQPQSVDQSELHHGLHQPDAAEGAERRASLVLEGPDGVGDITLELESASYVTRPMTTTWG